MIEHRTVYVVAADYGCYEGWQEAVGVYSDQDKALAAIGKALIDRVSFADRLRITALELDGPVVEESQEGGQTDG